MKSRVCGSKDRTLKKNRYYRICLAKTILS